MHRAAYGAEQLLVRNRGSANGRAARRGRFLFPPLRQKGGANARSAGVAGAEGFHPLPSAGRGSARSAGGMQRTKQKPSPSIPFLLRKGEEKHALRKGEAEPGDAPRHLPLDVNKCEIAGVKKCERVPRPRGTRPVRFSAGEAATGIGTKAASFHPSFWLTGPLARGVRIRGLHLGHSQPVDQFPQAQRNQP